MSKKTPLYDQHKASNATIVDFSGWQMPLHYGSQINEHHAVRKNVGLFDVSHMGVVEVRGEKVVPFLRYVFANDVAKLVGSETRDQGSALYTCMLNENGGVIDDLIAYRFDDQYFRLVINAGCRDKDMAWLQNQAKKFDVELNLLDDLCVLALQGPHFLDALKHVFDEDVIASINQLKPFQFLENPPAPTDQSSFSKGVVASADSRSLMPDAMITRTGYTGEPGVEIILPIEAAQEMWDAFITAGVQPCGLGARDTLRLEAGYNLFGADMTENTSPLISNLSWTVSFKDESRDFIGKKALLAEKEKGITQKLIGLVLESKGVLRNHQIVKCSAGTGEITSGSFSPTLNKSIALARIPVCDDDAAKVERRGEWLDVRVVKPKFV